MHENRRGVVQRSGAADDPFDHVDISRWYKESARGLLVFLRFQVFPTDKADGMPRCQASVTESVNQARIPRAVLPWQAERLGDQDFQIRQASDAGIALRLIAGDQHATPARPEQKEGFLETRLESAEKGDVPKVLAIGIDDEPVPPGFGVSRVGSGDKSRRRDLRPLAERTEIGQGDGP